MELDFDATEERNDYVTVPAGSYVCRVAEVRERSTRGGEPLWAVQLVVCEGEHSGRQAAWDNLVFSQRGRARARRVFEAFGLPSEGKVNVEPQDLQGKVALVEVRAAEYRNSQNAIIKRNEVPYDGYRPLAKGDAIAQSARGKTAADDRAGGGAEEEIPF